MSEDIIDKVKGFIPGYKIDLISQGAEALVFLTDTHPYLPKTIQPSDIENTSKFIIKYRPFKTYRHPCLDKQITKSRTAGEAKILNKLYSLNIKAPKLIAMDAVNGIIWMEFLGYRLENGDFSSLKNWLWWLEKTGESASVGESAQEVMRSVGKIIGELHLNDLIHGDLTSSNIILINKQGMVCLIDFGLSSYSSLIEDKAVDLYVLERALISTHPVYATLYNDWLLEGYHTMYQSTGKNGSKNWREVIRRLEDVRMRGRKRSLLG